ncbi:uncharacterized protein EI97DRAFT_474586 [Westerdykella ornata]|uniref:F-box domain-containing protein n=1 Tax=Westerdykella ornata TaxID=318751 RepID=A0A6A6JH03_WESOR|nr:uncharacterized protein EI97DRAFT_474586 [Westerdykella ornata]KAF2275940.1 hypothetical protein EI97DRAFT_474586 [Westerdykella ornata]
MTTLASLPSELLHLILEWLADIDLRSLFASRRTCHAFQTLATDILENPSYLARHGVSINKFLQSHFGPILDSSAAGEDNQPSYGQGYVPYFGLPWTVDANVRETYLRVEASWRRIPLSSPSGHIVRKLQQIYSSSQYDDEGKVSLNHLTGGDVWFYNIASDGAERHQFPEGVPLGLLYDMILGYSESLACGGWELLFDTSVADCERWRRLVGRCTAPGEHVRHEDVKALFVHEPNTALLYFPGFERDVGADMD